MKLYLSAVSAFSERDARVDLLVERCCCCVNCNGELTDPGSCGAALGLAVCLGQRLRRVMLRTPRLLEVATSQPLVPIVPLLSEVSGPLALRSSRLCESWPPVLFCFLQTTRLLTTVPPGLGSFSRRYSDNNGSNSPMAESPH